VSPNRAYRHDEGSVDPLATIKIVSPCTVPWAGMTGDETVRHCGQCRKNVYNVAAMTSDEARAVIQNAEGDVCLRLARRADGTVVTGDCRARLRAARQRGVFAFAGTLVVMLAVEIWAQAFGLRALSAFLQGPRSSPVGQDEFKHAPAIRTAARPRLSDVFGAHHVVAGGAAFMDPGLRPIGVVPGPDDDDDSPRFLQPSVATALKESGDDPPIPLSLLGVPLGAKVCVSRTGTVESVMPVRGVNLLMEESVVRTVKGWTYRPFVVEGVAVPFCTFLRFHVTHPGRPLPPHGRSTAR
jgi:hypothetical protein